MEYDSLNSKILLDVVAHFIITRAKKLFEPVCHFMFGRWVIVALGSHTNRIVNRELGFLDVGASRVTNVL